MAGDDPPAQVNPQFVSSRHRAGKSQVKRNIQFQPVSAQVSENNLDSVEPVVQYYSAPVVGLGTANERRKERSQFRGKIMEEGSPQKTDKEAERAEGYAEVDRRAKKRITDKVLLYNRLERSETGYTHLVNFLLYLWAPDNDGMSCPYIMMKDTLIIINGVPRHWLFLDKQGNLKKRNSVRLKDREDIINILCKGLPRKSRLQAAVHIQPPHVDAASIIENPTASIDAMSCVQQLDETKLRNMIHANTMPDGLVQSFTTPFPDTSAIVTCTWYPNFFYHDRQMVKNRRRFAERGQVGPGGVVEEKEGGEELESQYLTEDHRSCLLTKRLQIMCDAIAKHVTKVSPQNYQIGSMRLHFKHDMEGKLWLLFCSSLELLHSKHKEVRSESAHRAHQRARKSLDPPNLREFPIPSPPRHPSARSRSSFDCASPPVLERSMSAVERHPPLGDELSAPSLPALFADSPERREFHSAGNARIANGYGRPAHHVSLNDDMRLAEIDTRPKRPPPTYAAPTILPSNTYERVTTPAKPKKPQTSYTNQLVMPPMFYKQKISKNPNLVKPEKINTSPVSKIWSSKSFHF